MVNCIDQFLLKQMIYIAMLQDKVKEKMEEYNNPLVIFIIVLAVIFIAWALGEFLCWQHGRTHFAFAVKIRDGVFDLGCR